MKQTILSKLPASVLDCCRRVRRFLQPSAAPIEAPEAVFSDIYANNRWGGDKGTFFSGDGTRDEAVFRPYLDLVGRLAWERGFSTLTCVDLGCGDMAVGEGLIPLFGKYIGVDVVPDLIDSHRRRYCQENVEFQILDIVDDPLPDGEVCMIRQVLQHLSNRQIQAILGKLSKYPLVIFTEHLPKPNARVRKNREIPKVGGLRLADNSGVYLTAAPFGLAEQSTEVVLEVEAYGGIIQTMLYTPPKK